MTEPTTEQPEQPQQPEPQQPTEPETERAGEAKGYALYDLSELRFVGRVQPSKAKANHKDNHVKREGHSYEVREV